MKILVTGGMGYIGSHTIVELLNEGNEVIVIDNLCNSKLDRKVGIEKITNKKFRFHNINLCDYEETNKIFQTEEIDAVIHFAALKAVGESVKNPIKYYLNNLYSTLNLLNIMDKNNVRNFVFSSSATVYGNAEKMPIKEEEALSSTNPYGKTKVFIEEFLRDIYYSNMQWNIAILRYFNPIGAHESGLIGEEPNGIPNNLMPYITKVAKGELKELRVFGNDYGTSDGTPIRDYIHVVDLAKGHIKALDLLRDKPGLVTYNLGTGTGYTVMEVLKEFERVTEVSIPYKVVERRAGDVEICYADSTKANEELGWKAERTIEDMCRDTWRWEKNNVF